MSGTVCLACPRVAGALCASAPRRLGGALAVGEERGLLPDRHCVDALGGLARPRRVGRVQVDAVGAAVELRGPDPDQLAQPGVEVDLVELLGGGPVEVGHGAGEAVGVGVEVEADGDLRKAVGCCHGHDVTDLNGPG